MSKVDRFWSHEAQNIRCVRESDYDALRAELATLKAGQGEAVAHRLLNSAGEVISDWQDGPAPTRLYDFCGRVANTHIECAYTALPATGVIVPRELLDRLVDADFTYGAHGMKTSGFPILDELRALLAQSQEVKS